MTRFESRSLSRSRTRIETMSPCERREAHPFDYLFAKLLNGKALTAEEKAIQHQVKMASEQKSAKARQNRKRNKV